MDFLCCGSLWWKICPSPIDPIKICVWCVQFCEDLMKIFLGGVWSFLFIFKGVRMVDKFIEKYILLHFKGLTHKYSDEADTLMLACMDRELWAKNVKLLIIVPPFRVHSFVSSLYINIHNGQPLWNFIGCWWFVKSCVSSLVKFRLNRWPFNLYLRNGLMDPNSLDNCRPRGIGGVFGKPV